METKESEKSVCKPGEFLLTCYIFPLAGASLIAQSANNLPAMQETLVGFVGREDPLEKG